MRSTPRTFAGGAVFGPDMPGGARQVAAEALTSMRRVPTKTGVGTKPRWKRRASAGASEARSACPLWDRRPWPVRGRRARARPFATKITPAPADAQPGAGPNLPAAWATIRRHAETLQQRGCISVVTLVAAQALGFESEMIVEIMVAPPLLDKVAHELSTYRACATSVPCSAATYSGAGSSCPPPKMSSNSPPTRRTGRALRLDGERDAADHPARLRRDVVVAQKLCFRSDSRVEPRLPGPRVVVVTVGGKPMDG